MIKLETRSCPRCGLTQCYQPKMWTWLHFGKNFLAYECWAARTYAIAGGLNLFRHNR